VVRADSKVGFVLETASGAADEPLRKAAETAGAVNLAVPAAKSGLRVGLLIAPSPQGQAPCTLSIRRHFSLGEWNATIGGALAAIGTNHGGDRQSFDCLAHCHLPLR
jgi:hypothetical protein